MILSPKLSFASLIALISALAILFICIGWKINPTTFSNLSNKATANLFIVTPFRDKNGGIKKAGLFDTHPSIDQRIEALQNIQ